MLRLTFLLLFISLGFIFLKSDLQAQTVIRGPYLQLPTPSSIIIRWRTDVPSLSRVRYGASPTSLSNQIDSLSMTTEHRIQISGLSPYTKFYYSVGDTSKDLSGPDNTQFFRTLPIPGTVNPYEFWVIGDFGKASTQQQRVRDSYINHFGLNPPDLWLWLGDNAYDTGTDQEYQDKVFDSVYAYYSIMKQLPFYPCPGNHDYGSVNLLDPPIEHTGPYYDIIDVPTNAEAGGLATGHELFYSWDYGNAHFISINSELTSWITSQNTTMATWLKDDLAANDKKWTIVYWHQPPYTKGSHDSDDFWEIFMLAMRVNFVPIMDQYGVDLVLCGHSHVYERSFLIKDHTGYSSSFGSGNVVNGTSGSLAMGKPYHKDTTAPAANSGTVYANIGNSGSNESSPPLNHPAMYFGWGCDTCVGSLILNIHGDTLAGNYLSADGSFLDEFTILKGGPVAIDEEQDLDKSTLQISPNPFSSSTRVEYEISEQAEVKLEVFDIQGKLLKRIVNEIQNPGAYEVELSSTDFVSFKGVLIVQLTVGNNQFSQKVLKFE